MYLDNVRRLCFSAKPIDYERDQVVRSLPHCFFIRRYLLFYQQTSNFSSTGKERKHFSLPERKGSCCDYFTADNISNCFSISYQFLSNQFFLQFLYFFLYLASCERGIKQNKIRFELRRNLSNNPFHEQPMRLVTIACKPFHLNGCDLLSFA